MIVRAIQAELVKIATVRATKWLLLGSIAAALAISVIVAVVIRNIGETIDDVGVVALARSPDSVGCPASHGHVSRGVIGVLSVTHRDPLQHIAFHLPRRPNRWVALFARLSWSPWCARSRTPWR